MLCTAGQHAHATAQLLVDRYDGDLRRLRAQADGDVDTLRGLKDYPRLVAALVRAGLAGDHEVDELRTA